MNGDLNSRLGGYLFTLDITSYIINDLTHLAKCGIYRRPRPGILRPPSWLSDLASCSGLLRHATPDTRSWY